MRGTGSTTCTFMVQGRFRHSVSAVSPQFDRSDAALPFWQAEQVSHVSHARTRVGTNAGRDGREGLPWLW